jgi:hypothetical protein
MDYLTTPISVFLGLLAPMLTAILKDCTWPAPAKALTSLAVCVVLAALTVAITTPFSSGTGDIDTYLEITGTIFMVSTMFYITYFRGTTWDAKLTAMGYPKTPETPDPTDTIGK